ncbi:hypothetical protein [Plantactinospora sp. KBS50]|uniref:hypothetical protein n=1 Tax=Plantactinospora sp. KBS50 TaxID=2024580 RepID=UPI0012FD155B|nr:hypothetical protein [Plantactinospora sp. KBS50]
MLLLVSSSTAGRSSSEAAITGGDSGDSGDGGLTCVGVGPAGAVVDPGPLVDAEVAVGSAPGRDVPSVGWDERFANV